jgi:hypothetical protein
VKNDLQKQLERNLRALEHDEIVRPDADRTEWIEQVWELYWILQDWQKAEQVPLKSEE